jgi:hypothetical protein
MAQIRIPFLRAKTNKSGLTRWYWEPSATLKKKGWTAVALGEGGSPECPPPAIVDAARAQNRKVDEASGASVRQVRRIARPLTFGELVDAHRNAGFPSVRRPGAFLEPASQRQFRSRTRILRAWAEDGRTPCVAITSQRVAKLRDALLKPAASGRWQGQVRARAAQETLNVGRALWKWGEREGLLPRGSNPFADHGAGAPAPRDQIWWPPAREAIIAQAEKEGEPNLALAIDLAFQIGQREADLLRTILSQYAEIPAYKMDPDVHAALRAVPVPPLGDREGYTPGDVRGIRIRQAKGRRWVEVPVVGQTRARVEAAIADARKRGLATILFDARAGTTWTAPNPDAGQRRFIRRFAELRDAAIAAARAAGDDALAAELEDLQYRDFRRTAVVHQGELGLADQLVAAITGHSLDATKKILETYMPRTTGMAARAIALSHARAAPVKKSAEG